MFDFIKITVPDVIDILLVAILIYLLFRQLRGTPAFGIFIVITFLYFLKLGMMAFNMKLISSILNQILGVGLIAIIILFQQEIRRYIVRVGNTLSEQVHSNALLRQVFKGRGKEINMAGIEEISMACKRMSDTKTGALIVFAHTASLEFVIETGDTIDAAINRRLIENLFYKNTPLHDGAMVIVNDRIVAARCTLPIVENPDIPPQFGLRHRAAVSITTDTDADAVVVSEETGNISFVTKGEMQPCTSISQLKLFIENSFKK